MRYFIKAKGFLLEDRQEESKKYLEVIDGKFGKLADCPPEGTEILDYQDYFVAPGLFDTHIHGVNGADVMDGTQESFQTISRSLLKIGVTRFLPTTLTSSIKQLTEVSRKLGDAIENGLDGAQPEGIYLEGPYFTPEHKGAQNPKYFSDPSLEDFQAIQEASGHHVVKIALAPERKNALSFIKKLSDENIKVALGHTDADFHTASKAVKAGASIFVHLFNGMKGLHHRDPGTAGACLLHGETFAELICDGHHVCSEMVKLAYGVKKEHITLITDCMKAGLLPDGHYNLGEFPVIVQEGVARTVNTGSLAGSVLKLIDGVKNIQRWTGIENYQAWKLGSLAPAQSMGVQDRIGSISEGKCADFVVIDQDFNIYDVAVDGELKSLDY
ncbi:N-acetylglucosamine-6-phosphate deacetylase [Sporolactobacillus sp. THM7-4]|nr:N-acetylglucosamine-6-phosphate deacetylase [Sporolactobacillus sp. THM7-4]